MKLARCVVGFDREGNYVQRHRSNNRIGRFKKDKNCGTLQSSRAYC